ncbi:MAG: hydantoinase/oxoprolinase family protein [Thermaerobacter sp.]|nr:5-oxoprolinase [Bacillota bacterium]REJ38283.1 MAG: 5-oxoprolinase [Bacillota bacterium]
MRIAVDVGGTFTDVILLDEEKGEIRLEKTETTPQDPAQGVLAGFDKVGADLKAIRYFIHGTTLGLNALLTRSGARVAIVTTEGFRDVFILGRTSRDVMYDFKYRKPEPLVPRYLCFEVPERMNFEGKVLKPFDYEAARKVAERIKQEAVESVAVCFLHSYVNPAHEIAMGEVLQQVCPGVSVTLSHELSREYREYERTSTTVIDAYIKPLVKRYLEKLDGQLRSAGFEGRFLMTRSGGGAYTLAAAVREPVHLVHSGPAGGAIGAAYIGQLIGEPNIITLDMGGTSLDASLIVGGQVHLDTEAKVEGLPVSVPMIDIRTIGAGGGSIGWIDDGGHLQMGPKSAGALPGPACYGKGGQNATFTDAALVAGYLDPENFLGGEVKLHPDLARQAVGRLAERLGLSVEQTAAGMIRITEAKIAGAIREISIERGYHPKDFALLSFGGAGGFVSTAVAREIGIPRVIVPIGPANFSALGMLMVDVTHDLAQTHVTRLDEMDVDTVNGIYAELIERARELLRQDGFSDESSAFEPWAEMRYAGQEHTVRIRMPGHRITSADLPRIVEDFNAAHLQAYGHRMDDPVEVVTLRLRALGLLARPQLPPAPESRGGAAAARKGERQVHRFDQEGTVTYAVYDRRLLGRGDTLEGPAIVEEPSTTVLLHQGDRLRVGDHGELIIEIGGVGQ